MPVHLLLLGAASAGKSFTLGVTLRLLPPEAHHIIEAGSPRVLIYDTADLKHRVAVFGEADSLPAGEDNPAASAIRALLQEHRLRYSVVEKDDSGQQSVREIEKDGPTVLITTAVKRLGAQLDSRLFILEVPDADDHIRAALRAQADLELHGSRVPDETVIAFQSYLQALAPWDVVVPFVITLSEMIGRSISAPRIMRDFQRLLSLVKAVTILRHPHRKRDRAGRLIAAIEDYATVYELVGDMYEASNSGASNAIREVVSAVAFLRVEGVDPVRKKHVAERLGINEMAAGRRIGSAIRRGWLTNEEPKRGKPANLVPGDPLPEALGLPTPKVIEEASGNTVTGDTDGSRREPGEEG